MQRHDILAGEDCRLMARMEVQGMRAQIRDETSEPCFILVVTIAPRGSGKREGIDRASYHAVSER